jgi:tripartite-type tricarboxylate transporter receptor subunit TctC
MASRLCRVEKSMGGRKKRKNMRSSLAIVVATLAVLLLPCTGQTDAQSGQVADFYKGKQVSLYIGTEVGGGYDVYGRILARHLGRHIPGNPAVVVRNMPGAGSLTMGNYIVNGGPSDGTAIAAPQSSLPFEALLHLASPGGKAANFDPTKLSWIGNAAQDVFVLFAWHAAKAKSMSDLTTTELTLGAAGPNTDGALLATALNKVLGTRIKLVVGYQSSGAHMLAMERGELDAAALAYTSLSTMRPDWVRNGLVRILVQCGVRPHPDLGQVPFVLDLVKSASDREVLELIFSKYQLGRPYFVAPGVPADRVEALRKAFDDTMKDPQLLADSQQSRVEISPMSGAEVQARVEALYRSPQALVLRAREVLGTQ